MAARLQTQAISPSSAATNAASPRRFCSPLVKLEVGLPLRPRPLLRQPEAVLQGQGGLPMIPTATRRTTADLMPALQHSGTSNGGE